MRGQGFAGSLSCTAGGNLLLAPRAPGWSGQAAAAAAASNRGIQSFPREMNPMLLSAPSVQPYPHTGLWLCPRLRTPPPRAVCSRLPALLT